MSETKPQFKLNENLRFVPVDPADLARHIELLKLELKSAMDPSKRVSLLGEIAVYLRTLDCFDDAESCLLQALETISLHNLGVEKKVQQQIRLAHVWQEKKEFVKSDGLFSEVINCCRENGVAKKYLDFALQHAGKSYFDQGYYQAALAHFTEALKIRIEKKSPADQIESSQKAIQTAQERIKNMDLKTMSAYSENATDYSNDWLAQPEPIDMYELLQRHFLVKGDTADIGCGNGRDSNWLSKNGFQVTGYDASPELIKLASGLYPHIQFHHAVLPALAEVQKQFDSILCETVIMHLAKEQIHEAVRNLKRILKKGGVLYLSWRVTEKADHRHDDGRLYSAFDPDFIVYEFESASILHFEDKISKSSGKRVCRLVYRKE